MFKRPFQALADEIVAEAQATVTGRVRERSPGQAAVPGWVVVNALAHGDWDGLQAVADGARPGSDPVGDAVVRFLAAETLSVGGSAAGLRRVQREYLVPLELDLLAEAVSHPRPPNEAVATVRAQLARARAKQRHPTGAPSDE